MLFLLHALRYKCDAFPSLRPRRKCGGRVYGAIKWSAVHATAAVVRSAAAAAVAGNNIFDISHPSLTSMTTFFPFRSLAFLQLCVLLCAYASLQHLINFSMQLQT